MASTVVDRESAGTRSTAVQRDTAPRGRRWWIEIGWRHVVGIVTIVLCVFPLIYVLSASLNPGGTLTGSNQLFRTIDLANYNELLEGNYPQWFANSIVICTVTSLGTVLMDHVDFGTLDGSDFAARALEEDIGTAASDATLGPRSIDVTNAVSLDVARGRNRSQFRLRFSPLESDGDFANDFASFAEADAATSGNGQAPVLALVVRLPR